MTKVTDPYLMIVNKEHHYDESMLENFKIIPIKDSDGDSYIEETTYNALQELFAFLKSSMHYNGEVVSAGRKPETQEQIRKDFFNTYYNQFKNQGLSDEQAMDEAQKKLDSRVALPYQSEHHLGLCVDIDVYGNFSKFIKSLINNPTFNVKYDGLRRRLGTKTKALKTVGEIMADYGFILRFPDGKSDITGFPKEDWHIRYVGKDHAKIITENNLTLEEYVSALESGKTFPNPQETQPNS